MSKAILWLAASAAVLTATPPICPGQTPRAIASGVSTVKTSEPAAKTPRDERATKEQIAKLFVAMHVREQAESVAQSLQLKIRQQLRMAVGNNNSALPQEQRNAVATLLNQYSARVPKLYTVDQMLSDMSAIYQIYLTRADADAAIAFYSSKAGEDLQNAEPKIVQQVFPTVLQRSKSEGDALTEEMKKALAVIKPEVTPASSLSEDVAKPLP